MAVASVERTSGIDIDWRQAAELALLSRALDDKEEHELVPAKEIFYQFSARGCETSQILLGLHLTHSKDVVGGYYRSRPLLLALGGDPLMALASCMGRVGGYSDGRDIGAVFNLARPDGPQALPMSGGVGAQYTPAVGWAQAIVHHRDVLGDPAWAGAIAVAHGGEASAATNGFWSALTIATTLDLPMLFFIEDNGYGISVPSALQTPGGDIAANLAAFKRLAIWSGDGTDPDDALAVIGQAVAHVRAGKGAALARLVVPRLQGHSAQDTQTYKTDAVVAAERARDPLPKLKARLVPDEISATDWDTVAADAKARVESLVAKARSLPHPDPATMTDDVFASPNRPPITGGLLRAGWTPPASSDTPKPDGARINMVTAIRRTLDHELKTNPRVLVFGEDVGPKGGVHAVTMGLQEAHGPERVFDTSLSEEGIIGRAVGMAMAGLMPAAEIQFRKYADPACEQLNDCGTMRWRTANHFAAPIVVRIAGGFFKCGDPWHSQTNEVQFVHAIGWRVAAPSNAEDAVGLLRAALRGDDPSIFFEHRAQLDAPWARRPYPGDDYVLPFGHAKITRPGGEVTVATWGAMVERCEKAAEIANVDAEVIDLRTLAPWDAEAVLASVRKTKRCLIVHEDNPTAGFGAEIAARVADEAFLDLDAPIRRLTMPDIPSPYAPVLLEAAVPSAARIADALIALTEF